LNHEGHEEHEEGQIENAEPRTIRKKNQDAKSLFMVLLRVLRALSFVFFV
jgi:hypothetical protein